MSASSSMPIMGSPYERYSALLSQTGQLSDATGSGLYEKLERAIDHNDIESIKQILHPLSADEKIEILNRLGKYNENLLSKAIENLFPEVMRLLLTEGAKLTDRNVISAIEKMSVFQNKHKEILTVILQRIDNPNFLRLYDQMTRACKGSLVHIEMIAAHRAQIILDPHSVLRNELELRSPELREKDARLWKCVGASKTEEGCIYRFVFFPNGNPKPFPAVEPTPELAAVYFPDELIALKLGYHREVHNGHVYVELPDENVLRNRGIAGIVSAPGILDDIVFADLVSGGYVPLSTGADFFHDHAAHVVRRILNVAEGYSERIQQIEKGIGHLVRVARQVETILERSPNGICDYTQALSFSEKLEGLHLKASSIEESIALNQAMLKRLQITIGMLADLISSAVLSKQSRIDYLIPLIEFDVVVVLKKMWSICKINEYLNQRSREDLLGYWSISKQPEFDRFLTKVLDKIKDTDPVSV